MDNNYELTQAIRDLDYGFTMAVSTLVLAMGMHAENMDRQNRGEAIAYTHEAFENLINENGIHHNAVIGRQYHR